MSSSSESSPVARKRSREADEGPRIKHESVRKPIVWDKSNDREPDPELLLTKGREERKDRGAQERDRRGEGRTSRHRDGDRDRRDSPERPRSRGRGGQGGRELDSTREGRRRGDNSEQPRPRGRGSTGGRELDSRDDRRDERWRDNRGHERSSRGREDRRDRAEEAELPVARGRGSLRGRAAARDNANGDGHARPSGQATNEEGPAETKAESEAAKPVAKATKAGGAYIPPFRLAQMMQEATSKTDPAYQRLTWDALRKSINGLINKANAQNIRPIIKELLSENLHRGRGLFCLGVMKSQVASPSYTPVFAALVAVMATRLPEVATLLVHRLVAQFKRAFKRNDRALTSSVVTFLCHLANQQVVPTLLVAEILLILLAAKTDDSVELAATALKESGALLQDSEPAMLRMVMDEMRQVLQEGQVDKRVQYIVEALFKVQRDGFAKSGNPQIPDGLDLLEDADKMTVNFDISSDVPDVQQGLNIFKADPDFEAHEKEYEEEAKKWFDEDSDSDSEGDSDDDSSEEEAEEAPAGQGGMQIQDQTDTNLINLRRTIYLTIMSSMDFEEAGHKLMKIELRPGQEMEIVTMIIECCSQEKTYLRYYGLLAQRYCGHRQTWQALFEDCFRKQYMFVHRLETNKLRNVGRLFAHLLATDSISWAVLDCIRITEDDTTSSSRIFIKILFQDMAENMGLESLNSRLQDPECLPWFQGIFPKDNPRNVRFSINFFTSIGLGGVTQQMREYLKELPKLLAAQKAAAKEADSDSSDSSSSDDSSSSSDSSDDSDSSSSDSDSSDSSSSDDSDSSSDESSSGTEITDPPSKHRRGADRPVKSPKPSSQRRDQRHTSRKDSSSKRPREQSVELPSKRIRESHRHERSERSRH